MPLHNYTPDPKWDGIFSHKCEQKDCPKTVDYDDEPFCFTHSPDEGSSVKGYSARMKAEGLA